MGPLCGRGDTATAGATLGLRGERVAGRLFRRSLDVPQPLGEAGQLEGRRARAWMVTRSKNDDFGGLWLEGHGLPE